jgi:hypothetical protein
MRFDKATKIGFGLCGGLLVVVLIVVLMVNSTKSKRRADEAAHDQALATLMATLEGFNLANEGQAQQLIKTADDQVELWRGTDIASKVKSLQIRAQQAIENSREINELKSRFEEVKRDFAAPDKLAPERIKELRRTLEETEGRAGIVSEAFLKEVTDLRKNSERIAADAMVAKARADAAANDENPRLARRTAIAAEEMVGDSFTRAFREKREEDKKYFEPLYKEMIALVDSLALKVFTASPSESLGWKDMFSAVEAKGWNPTTAQGFSWRIDGGTMQVVGPDAGVNKQAILAIGDNAQWRDVVLELEMMVEKGSVDVVFRLGRNPTEKNPTYVIDVNSDTCPFKAGDSIHIRASVIGNKFIVRGVGEDDSALKEEELNWTMTRKGAIGLVIPPGSRFKITSFKVRELL